MFDLPPLAALAPGLLLGGAALARLRPGCRPGPIPILAEIAALLALASTVGAAVHGAVVERPVADGSGAAALLRTDPITAALALLIAFVGWVIVRYARSYLDGEPREGLFHALLLAALATALVLVQAGSLLVFWLASAVLGAILYRLLRFYPERVEARRAAAKFGLAWAAGSASLGLATGLIWLSLGTPAFPTAAVQPIATGGWPALVEIAVVLLVLAALLKTAAFPFHGWVTEVMEAPTPVSALLHAGVINAGGILLVRSADLVQASAGAMALLVIVGGFTALYASAVMLTQSAVKTALAWSTVAQMGFMLLQCGLGLWALALLHILAHSLYKAHAFLSSGSAVEAVAFTRRPGPVAVPNLAAVGRAFALALALYAAVAVVSVALTGPKPPQALALGVILIFGVAYLLAQGLADEAPRALTRRTAIASTGAAIAYFAFHVLAIALWQDGLPPPPVPGPLEWALVVIALGSFGLVAVAQSLFPLWAHHPSTAGLRVHLVNGLYVNAVADRLIGGFRTPQPSRPSRPS